MFWKCNLDPKISYAGSFSPWDVIFTYSSVLNRSHVATIWNFDPNYSLPNVTQVSLPKKFQIVATWLQFSTKEYTTSISRFIRHWEDYCCSSVGIRLYKTYGGGTQYGWAQFDMLCRIRIVWEWEDAFKGFFARNISQFGCVCFVLKRSIGFIQPPQQTESLKPPHAQALLSFYVFAKLYFFGGLYRWREEEEEDKKFQLTSKT